MENNVALTSRSVREGDVLPGRTFVPDNIQLFLYNAVLFNAHRIHFDHPYACDVEGYPGLVVPGPLLGDWLNQCVEEWLGDHGWLKAIEYSNRIAAYSGETLHSGGTVTAVDPQTAEATIDVFVKNERGEVITPGTATVVLVAATEVSP